MYSITSYRFIYRLLAYVGLCCLPGFSFNAWAQQPIDVFPGSANSSNPSELTAIGNRLVFNATSSGKGKEPHISDGTVAGTKLLKDIFVGTASSNARYFTELTLGGVTYAYFFANDAANSGALYRANIATGVTEFVINVNPSGSTSTTPGVGKGEFLVNVNGTLFFAGQDPTGRQELFKSDGTAAGTSLVKDINTNPIAGFTFPSNPQNLTNINGRLFFTADNQNKGTGDINRELWVSDGTAAGTQLVKDINPSGNSHPIHLVHYKRRCYFFANDGSGIALWRSDGTESGTRKLYLRNGTTIHPEVGLVSTNRGLFFSATYAPIGTELWRSDGAGIFPMDVNRGPGSSTPKNLTDYQGFLYFTANVNNQGIELWYTTMSGPHLVKDIQPGVFGSNPENLTVVKSTVNGIASNVLYFTAFTSNHGRELWKSNGTTTGTQLVKDINPSVSTNASKITELATVPVVTNKDVLFFNAFNGDNNLGTELWSEISATTPNQPLQGLYPNICQQGTVTLHASGATLGQAYRWYDSATSSQILQQTTEGSFTTPVLTASRTYYVSIVNEDESLESARTPLSVTVHALPDLSISGKKTVCAAETSTYTATHSASKEYNFYRWSVTNGTIISGGSLTDQDVVIKWNANVSSGKVSTTLSDANGCISTVHYEVSIGSPTITGNNAVCAESTSTYTADNLGSNYTWNVTNGTILSDANTNTITVQWHAKNIGPLGVNTTPGKVSLTGVTTTGCQTSIDYAVTINHLPQVISLGNDKACAGSLSSYVSSSLVNSHAWNVSNGTIVSGANTNAIIVQWNTNATEGTVSLTETSLAGCVTTLHQQISLMPGSNPSIIGPDVVCGNGSQVYNTPITSGSSYHWEVVNGSIISGADSPEVTIQWNTNESSGTVKLTETSATKCKTSVDYQVSITPSTTFSITGPSKACANTTSSYVTDLPGNSYTWSVTNGTIISGTNTNTITVQWNANASNGQVKLTETGANGCQSSAQKDVTINNALPIIFGPGKVCKASNSEYTSTNVGNSYAWSVTNGTIVSGANASTVTIKWDTQATQGTVNLVETNSDGCQFSVSYPVTIDNPPNPAITGPSVVCSNSVVDYQVANYQTNTLGSIYLWRVTNGFISEGVNAPIVHIKWDTQATNGILTLTEVSAAGCQTTIHYQVAIGQAPTFNITGSQGVCAESSTTYTTNYQSNSYAWNVTNGTILSGANTNTITVKWHANNTGPLGVNSTQGRVSLSSVTTAGCQIYTEHLVTVNHLPQVHNPGPQKACSGTLSTYTSNSLVNSHVWNVTNGTIVSGTNTHAIVVQWNTNATQGTVNLTETSPAGCQASASYPVSISARPKANIIGTKNACVNDLNGYGADINGNTHQWQVTNGSIVSGQGTPDIMVQWNANSSTGTVTLIETNAAGCTSTADYLVTIYSAPTPVITGASTVNTSQTSTYSTPDTPGNLYGWQVTNGTLLPGANTSTATIQWNDNAGTGLISMFEFNPITSCFTRVEYQVTIQAPTADALKDKTVIYPNPAESEVTVKLDLADTGTGKIIVRNTQGQALLTHSFKKESAKEEVALQLNTLRPGIYWLEIRIGDKQETKRIIKK